MVGFSQSEVIWFWFAWCFAAGERIPSMGVAKLWLLANGIENVSC